MNLVYIWSAQLLAIMIHDNTMHIEIYASYQVLNHNIDVSMCMALCHTEIIGHQEWNGLVTKLLFATFCIMLIECIV